MKRIWMLLVGLAMAGMPAAAQSVKLYVVNQTGASIAVIDEDRMAVDTIIDLKALGFPANAKPHHVAVEPDGSYWYVSLIGANRVVKFDRQNNVAAQFEMETPGMLAFDGAERLVVTRSMSAVNPPKRIAVLRRATMQGDELDVLFPLQPAIELPHRLQHRQARVDRPPGVVLVRLGIAKVDQEPIPEVLRDIAVKALDYRGASLLVCSHHLAPVFRIKAPGQTGRVHQVTEQHGELTPFGVSGRAARPVGADSGWVGRLRREAMA